MLNRVFNAPVNLYFNSTPSGVILNRFSSDILVIDNVLVMTIRNCVRNALIIGYTIIMVVYNIIWVILVVPFLVGTCIGLMKTFSKALKETKRLENITNSPILTHLSETINGVTTIRAYEKVEEFENTHVMLQNRNFCAFCLSKGIQTAFNIKVNILSISFMGLTYLFAVR
jgi:ABC-type multidrug transport system fused ATPase/permease subunit